jgi:hypothetical protein
MHDIHHEIPMMYSCTPCYTDLDEVDRTSKSKSPLSAFVKALLLFANTDAIFNRDALWCR